MPPDFLALVVTIAVILIVLKLIKATAKLMVTAVILAIAVYVVAQYLGVSLGATDQMMQEVLMYVQP